MPVFTGVGVALVTLFEDDGALDAAATARLAVDLVDAGVRGVVVVGTTGEAATLDPAERIALLSAVRDAVPAATPVIAGTGAPSSHQAVRLTRDALGHGADAVLVLAPPSASDVRPYYDAVADVAGGPERVLAYHYPAVAPPGIPVPVLRDLPVAGCKDSSGDAGRLLEEVTTFEGSLYTGSAALLALAGPLGCAGAILSLANVDPERCARAFAGDVDAQRALAAPNLASRVRFPAGLKELVAGRVRDVDGRARAGMIEVRATDDPAVVLREAGGFLLARPIEHNVILTILHSRITHPEAGRYWWLLDEGAVAGVGIQTPRSFNATATPMDAPAVRALVGATDPPVPGFTGEAATAAAYAGAWAQRFRVAVAPSEGERLFRLGTTRPVGRALGQLRPATHEDRALLVTWLEGFGTDTGDGPGDVEVVVDRYLDEHSAWVWDDGGPVALARVAPVVGGVERIGPVYTPPERRRHGYATTCVEHLSRDIEERGHVAVLYTQLANPTSNAIYGRIGYEPVLEVLRYRFDPVPG